MKLNERKIFQDGKSLFILFGELSLLIEERLIFSSLTDRVSHAFIMSRAVRMIGSQVKRATALTKTRSGTDLLKTWEQISLDHTSATEYDEQFL